MAAKAQIGPLVLMLGAMLSSGTRAEALHAPITALAFSPDGAAIVVGSKEQLAVYSWPDRKLIRQIDSTIDDVHDLAFAPDGCALAIVGGSPGEFGKLEVVSWPAANVVFSAASHDDTVYAVAWNHASTLIATASHDHRVHVHDVVAQRTTRRIDGHSRGVKSVVFVGDHSEFLLSAGIDQSLRLWDVADGQLRRALNNHTQPVHDLAVRPAAIGSVPLVVSVSDDRSIRFWQPTIGRMIRFARLNKHVPLAVAWTRNGRHVVACCHDGRVRVVDPDTTQVVSDLAGIDGWAYSIAMHPRRDELAVGGERGQWARVPLVIAEE